jgi:hypothetical protein
LYTAGVFIGWRGECDGEGASPPFKVSLPFLEKKAYEAFKRGETPLFISPSPPGYLASKINIKKRRGG